MKDEDKSCRVSPWRSHPPDVNTAPLRSIRRLPVGSGVDTHPSGCGEGLQDKASRTKDHFVISRVRFVKT